MDYHKSATFFARSLRQVKPLLSWQEITDIVNQFCPSVYFNSKDTLRKRVSRIGQSEYEHEDGDEKYFGVVVPGLIQGNNIVFEYDLGDGDSIDVFFYEVEREVLVDKVMGYSPTKADVKKLFTGEKVKAPATVEDKVDVKDDDYKFIITKHVLVIAPPSGDPYNIDKAHKNFDKIKSALEEKNFTKVMELINLKTTINNIKLQNVEIDSEGNTYIKGNLVHNTLAKKVLAMLNDGNIDAVNALAKFQDRLQNNPSFKIVNRLYDFIDHSDIELTDDGHVLAFKVVDRDYKDLYSRKFDNSPGTKPEVDRNMVDDDMDKECSYGLHVCAVNYLSSYGNGIKSNGSDRIVKVKIDPADFVAVPPDYNFKKARVCKYEVLEDVTLEVRRMYFGTKEYENEN